MEKQEELLINLLQDKSPEEAAKTVLLLMQQKNPKILNLCNEEIVDDTLSDIICQSIAERGLKDILDQIKSQPINTDHLFAGAVLVAIKDLLLVKKYLWKDKFLVQALESFLKFAKLDSAFVLLRDIVAHIIQATLLGGTPTLFFDIICKSELIELYTDILRNKEKVKSLYSYEEILLTLLLLCQNNKQCIEKCHRLLVPQVLLEFSRWTELDENIKDKAEVASECIQHMVSLETLPDHRKLLLNKFSDHMHSQNKTCKRSEGVVCSYPTCGKVQPEDYSSRFKKCGRCMVTLYCSKGCQVAHWKSGHSKVCVSPT